MRVLGYDVSEVMQVLSIENGLSVFFWHFGGLA
jgi:hypothetical protein